MTNFPHIRAALARQIWAIDRDRFEEVVAVIERRLSGGRLSPEEIAALKGPRDPEAPNGSLTLQALSARAPRAGDQPSQGAAIGVINLFGILSQHAAQVDDISGPGGTSTERVAQSFRAALADPAIKSIVINFHSPGGTVYGVDELATEIFKARGRKPIVAQVNSLAASAAYWIATSASELVVTPGGEVGSIGAYAVHEDLTKAAEMKGLKVTIIAAGEHKAEGNSFQPLSDEARAYAQKRVNGVYHTFVTAVARGRGVSTTKVMSDFGKGRIVSAADAVRVGMADRVATLDETIRRLGASSSARPAEAARASSFEGARAEDVFRRRRHAHRIRAAAAGR